MASGEALGTQATQQGSTSAPHLTMGSAHFRQGRHPQHAIQTRAGNAPGTENVC